MNSVNLTPGNPATQFVSGRLAVEAQLKSAKARKRNNDIARLAARMLDQGLAGESAQRIEGLFPDLGEDVTWAAHVVAGQINAAAKGNTKAARFLLDLSDRESAKEAQEQMFRLNPLDLTTDCVEPYRLLHKVYEGKTDVQDFVFKGGRGGIKSTFGAELAYETIKQDPYANVVYGRRFGSDLRHTVFAQFCKVINSEGDQDAWEITKSPMRCTYKPTGTAAYFFGFDNAEQLKSFTPEVGYVKLLIFEEADEMLGNSQMDSAAQTFLRANGFEGVAQVRLKIYNPPPSKNNFMNEWVAEMMGDPTCAIFDFNYQNVPEEWLGESFLKRAEWYKENKPDYYANAYMGEVTGTGGELFDNVSEETITDEMVQKWQDQGMTYQGIDFGYEHPMAFIRVAYDRETDTVYPFFEHVKQRSSLSDFLEPLEKDGMDFRHQETIADSAEPDRINDMLDRDWDVVKSVKRWAGNRGRTYSWDWLRTRARIVVDISRTPRLAKELRTLEFEKLKGDTYSSRIPDLNEDCVMATIYALNRVIRAAE